MPFTPDEIRQWHEKRNVKGPPDAKPAPVAICVHCQQPFGISEGVVTPEVSICDVCNGD